GSARLVRDHERLPEDPLERSRQRPRRQVGDPTGRKRIHDGDGPRRILLLGGRAAGHDNDDGDDDESDATQTDLLGFQWDHGWGMVPRAWRPAGALTSEWSGPG